MVTDDLARPRDVNRATVVVEAAVELDDVPLAVAPSRRVKRDTLRAGTDDSPQRKRKVVCVGLEFRLHGRIGSSP